jgi:AcrR family transcriptional regulator
MSAPTAVEPRRDRRRVRHEATTQEIADIAWQMVRAEGLNGLSLRALARAVDMEPQSLYTYFSSKHALYDHLFAEGNQQLLTRIDKIEPDGDLDDMLRQIARLFVTFGSEDQARYELLFLRTIPEFEPSADSYAVASEVFARGRQLLAQAGVDTDRDFDLWTALVTGLASQQLANDPGGDRYLRLVDDAVDMFVGHLAARQAP